MRVLGINAVFHDSAAALVVDGRTVAAAEEERFSRRKHGKRPVPFSAWELPEQAIRWCLAEGGLIPEDLDAVAYSYDPALVDPTSGGLDPAWEDLRTTYAARAPQFLQTALPGYSGKNFHFVRHHVAHAASAAWRPPWVNCALADCAVLLRRRGEATSMLAGEYRDRKLDILRPNRFPHRSACYLRSDRPPLLRRSVMIQGDGDGFVLTAVSPVSFVPAVVPDSDVASTLTVDWPFALTPPVRDSPQPRPPCGHIQAVLEDSCWSCATCSRPHRSSRSPCGGVALTAWPHAHRRGAFSHLVQPRR